MFITTEIMFNIRLRLPRLLTTLISLVIMLLHTYTLTNQINTAKALLQRLNNEMYN